MDTKERVDGLRDELLDELSEFLQMPSISASEEDTGGFRECAEWVRGKLEDAGAEARLMETAGHPVVYAEIGSGNKTLLSYGHYDVQPPEPLELWDSEPFEPAVRGGSLYARGVADDKGDVMARIQALRLYIEEHGQPPFKLKFLIEGEEEVGSPNLADFVRANAELLAADACLWEGAMKDEAGRPSIECGTKGMAYVELRATGASHDLHSMYGGLAPNPVVAARAGITDYKKRSWQDHAGRFRRADRSSLRAGTRSHRKYSLRRGRPEEALGRRILRPRPLPARTL